MPKSGLLFEKKGNASNQILQLFERVRVAYLSARTDPKEYGSKWRSAIEYIKEEYDDSGKFGEELKRYINDKDLNNEDASDVTTTIAEKIYEAVKKLRYASDEVSDPFAKHFKDNVLEALLESPETMVKFLHYAMRNDNKALNPSIYSVKDMKPDTITDGLMGLDLEVDDIPLYIIEHYGDGKDSKKVEKKVKSAMAMLELLFFSKHNEEDWEELEDIDMETDTPKKMIEKSETEKGKTDFITPNKPMYRIFDIEDMEELKGFSGEYIVQEKYDGMRIQVHKIDNKIKVYSYNEKDITDKCKEIVEEMKKKHFGDCILDGELILFDGKDALHRADTIAHVFKGKYPDAKLKAHMFDIMRHNDKNIADEPLSDRLNTMFNNYSVHSSEYLNFPSKKDTRLADSIKEVEQYSKEIMDMPTAEGVVIKDSTSTYYIGTKKNPKWIKWKKFVDLDLIVLDKKKTKSKLYSYTLGAGPADEGQEINGLKYMNVGKALNTKISVDIGDIVRVKVDEVKKKGDAYSIYSAKVIEVPEVEYPDKLVTLELLSKDTKKSLNYDVKALEKGVSVTDYIHGETNVIIKGDMDGFTIYGFDESNLMSKNALANLDEWKSQAEAIMKTKQSRLTVAAFQHLKERGAKTPKELHDFLVKNHSKIYEDILESKMNRLSNWMDERDGISFDKKEKKLIADPDKIMQDEEEIKKSFLLKNQRLLQEAKELEEEVTISADADMEGDCCSKLKSDYLSILKESLDTLVKEYGGYKKYVKARSNPSNTYDYAPTLEEEHEEMETTVLDLSCEELVKELTEFFEEEGYEDIGQLLDEYKNCQFGEGFSDKYAMLKAYKTPKKLQEGNFKLYLRDDENLNLVIKLEDETLNWLIDLEKDDDIFRLFGKANKYPAQIATNISKKKIIDSGEIGLGVQKEGYHEYFLRGNKFETKLHFRVIEVDGKEMWLAWTGYKQKPADKDTDAGLWNIYEDKYKKLPLPPK